MIAGTHAKRLIFGFGAAPAAALMICVMTGPVSAQGSRLESLFNDAARFLERQGKTIERGLNQTPRRDTAYRKKKIDPPLPLVNPRRVTASGSIRTEPGKTVTSAPPAISHPEPERNPASEKAGRHAAKADAPSASGDAVEPLPEPAPASESAAAQAPVPLPDRNPGHSGTYGIPAASEPLRPSEIASEDWSQEEITAALAVCTGELAGIVVTYEVVDPIREGICGAPAPIRVSSIGVSPKVEIRPTATLTCHMAARLAQWIKATVQPAAKRYLESEVVALGNIASYSCRNRYNAPNKRISEHAYANALDVAAFVTASGRSVTVLDGWNAKQESDEAGDKPAANVETGTIGNAPESNEKGKPSPGTAMKVSNTAGSGAALPALDKKPDLPEPKLAPPEPSVESRFLHEAHDGACRIFGTTLGPEANEAHRNHFHLDMIERSYSGYCE